MKGKFSIRWLNGFGWGLFAGVGVVAIVHPLAGFGALIAGIGLMGWTSRKIGEGLRFRWEKPTKKVNLRKVI